MQVIKMVTIEFRALFHWPSIRYKRIGIGQCPIFYRSPNFSAKTHAAFVRNVNGLKPFVITFRTTTEAVVVGLTSNSA